MQNRDQLYIGGEWVKPNSTISIDVICPSNEEVIGYAPDSNSIDVDNAVAAARKAFDGGDWVNQSLSQRADLLSAALDILDTKSNDIAQLVSSEMGLPTSAASMLIPDAINTGRYFIEISKDIKQTEIRKGKNLAVVLKEPVGVVASIAAWNGPFSMAITKIIPALLSGCSVVFKPAPETPLDAYLITEALHDVGLPKGVFNLITGGRETGQALVSHSGVDKVSFTGSTVAGRAIGEECGRHFRRVQLELGGKSAAIVAEDADIPTTMQGLAMGSFFNTGQMCIAYSRVLVPSSLYDDFVAALCATAQAFVVGDPLDEATTMGPLVSEAQRSRVESYIAKGLDEGATLLTGGKRPENLSKGWYIEPTVFGNVTNQMTIAREEIFGPVVSVIPYETLDEAIAIANDSDFGLHGGVFTSSDETAYKVSREVRSGTFSVNQFMYNIEAPFGGVKCSGVGRDTGWEAIESYFELKTINITEGMEKLYL